MSALGKGADLLWAEMKVTRAQLADAEREAGVAERAAAKARAAVVQAKRREDNFTSAVVAVALGKAEVLPLPASANDWTVRFDSEPGKNFIFRASPARALDAAEVLRAAALDAAEVLRAAAEIVAPPEAVELPPPEAMHGACDGFGGEDAPLKPLPGGRS